ncbi:MAG: MarR family winged helix-turn-helix transcriptional regulator [Ghiorsea sp.]
MSIFDVQTPQQSVGFQFWKLHTQWQKKVHEILLPHGITHTQFVMLASIAWFEEQGVSPSQAQVGALMNLEKMTFSKAVRQLEANKLVIRKKSKEDARKRCLSLTAQALTLVPKAMQDVETIDKKIFGALGEHKQTFNKILLMLNKG